MAKISRRFCGATLMLGALALGTPARAVAQNVVIGVPIAQTGPYAFVGLAALRAMRLAVDQANDAKLLGDGRKIELVVADDGSERAQTITLVKRMTQLDKALVLVGLAGAPLALGGSAVANEMQIPVITFSTADAVTTVGKYSYHIMAGPERQIKSSLDYVLTHIKPKTVATIWGRDNESSMAQGKYVRNYLQGKVTLLPEESVANTDTDFSPLATKLVYAHPDVIVFTSPSESIAANAILQFRQAGVKSVIVSNTNAVGPGFLRIAGKTGEGTIAPADFSATGSEKQVRQFVADYQKRYNDLPDNWAALGYAAMQVAINAVKMAGPDPTRAAVRDALDATKQFPTVVGAGKFSFDAQREPDYDMAVVIMKNGVWVPVE